MNSKMINESPQARLPGRVYRKRGRWWWEVQLPGEQSPRSRALTPDGPRSATTDRQRVDEIAFRLWEEALRAQTRALVMAEQAARIQQLRLQFREKARALRDVIARAEARAEAETAERARLEVKLNGLRNQLTQMVSCGCCGRSVPESELQPIDSGQRLCRTCMNDLHRVTQRQRLHERTTQRMTRRVADTRLPQASGDPWRGLSSMPRSVSPGDFDDVLDRRDIDGADVLYAKAGSR
ncbi:MAG: hypothetical protein JW955_20770 [Sedimentisphaerales bacterium]|nr:hypothetical protein [Sedimentisphaerales bacterium]